jgi:hypothetical protein
MLPGYLNPRYTSRLETHAPCQQKDKRDDLLGLYNRNLEHRILQGGVTTSHDLANTKALVSMTTAL